MLNITLERPLDEDPFDLDLNLSLRGVEPIMVHKPDLDPFPLSPDTQNWAILVRKKPQLQILQGTTLNIKTTTLMLLSPFNSQEIHELNAMFEGSNILRPSRPPMSSQPSQPRHQHRHRSQAQTQAQAQAQAQDQTPLVAQNQDS